MDEQQIRILAFQWLKEQQLLFGPELQKRPLLEEGFEVEGRKIPLMSRQRGIWVPSGFQYPLSITTSPDNPYADDFGDDAFIAYHYFGEDPNHSDNRKLRAAMRDDAPLVYFLGLKKNIYVAVFPAFVVGEDVIAKMFRIAVDLDAAMRTDRFAVADQSMALARRQYRTAETKIRLHQRQFRMRVIDAYSESCALCRLRHAELLDAAHIIPDNDEHGAPIVPNGIALCKIHHAAFDANIMGITPEYRIEVNHRILEETDGPMLRHGIQELHGQGIVLPKRKSDWPDPERLEMRYKKFRLVG